jgi:hypothetical protein
VRWPVRNEGREAKEEGQLSHDTMNAADKPCWTSTAFKGRQKMIRETAKDSGTMIRIKHF